MSPNDAELAALLDPEHPLLRTAEIVRWPQDDTAGTSRLMFGLHLLGILRGLGDREVCEQWTENPYFQAFCGETRFRHQLDPDAASLARWRMEVGEDRLSDWVATVVPPPAPEPSTFVIDVDGVVAKLTPGNDYRLAEPIPEAIAAINRLYDRGHKIVMLTARGSATGISWQETTAEQFARWGLKFHELRFGKPAADYYVDDRMVSVGMLCAMGAGRPFPPSSLAPTIAAPAPGTAA